MYSSQREDDGDSSEAKEFPILCETCLGDNPYVRMVRARDICPTPSFLFRRDGFELEDLTSLFAHRDHALAAHEPV